MIELAIVIVLLMAFGFLVEMVGVVVILLYSAWEFRKMDREEQRELFAENVISEDNKSPPLFAFTRWLFRRVVFLWRL